MARLSRFFVPLLLAAAGACATNPATGKKHLSLMSEREEIELGHKTHKEILQQYRIYNDAELQAYVRRIGEKLARAGNRDNLTYHFTVLDSEEVNAFALPGGYIYITRWLMAYLNSEAELAAVLGHEIGHVEARHSVRQYSAAQVTNIGLTLGSLFIPGLDRTGAQLLQVFSSAMLKGYGREHELEADRLGAQYIAQSGYGADAMLDVIRVLKNQEEFEQQRARAEGRQTRVYHGLFATHPDNDTRLREVVSYARRFQGDDDVNQGGAAYLSRINGLVFGADPEQGVVKGNNFLHAPLNFGISFPSKWSVMNLPDKLIFADDSKRLGLSVQLEPKPQQASPWAFMRQRLGISRLAEGRNLTVNGLDAYTGVALLDNGFPARCTVIYHDEHAYILVGAVGDGDPRTFARHDLSFVRISKSFRPLSAAERAQAQTLRLKIIKADKQTSFTALAHEAPLEKYPEEQLRLLNGLYPNGSAASKMFLKVLD